MKKFIIAMAVAAFTVGAYAGEGCAGGEKANVAASCPASKKDTAQCPASGATAKKDAGKKVVKSPKDAANNKS